MRVFISFPFFFSSSKENKIRYVGRCPLRLFLAQVSLGGSWRTEEADVGDVTRWAGEISVCDHQLGAAQECTDPLRGRWQGREYQRTDE